MNVSKTNVYDILLKQADELPEKDWQWEIFLSLPDRPWSYRNVENIQKKLVLYEGFDFFRTDDVLEITTFDKSRLLTIEGLQNIKTYCDNEHFNEIPHTWHAVNEINKASIDNYYNINFESVISKKIDVTVDEASLAWSEMGKYFNQKRSIGFTETATGIVFVFEMTRGELHKAYNTMADAKLYTQKVETTIKVRMSGAEKKENVDAIVKNVLSHALFLYQEIMDEPYPLIKTEQHAIMKKYMKLIDTARDLSNYEKKNPTYFHLAPKPVTLERKNLIDPEHALGIPSIIYNYAATDKADGERMLLYIDEKNYAYLINSMFQVKNLGVQVVSSTSHKLSNTLLDGEYIAQHLLNDKGPSIFAIFDIYFMNGENLMKLPLMTTDGSPSRYAMIEMICDSRRWKMNGADISIEMKKHIVPTETQTIFDVCASILGEKNRRYNIDGLVFTPVDLPVFAYYRNEFKNLKGKSVAWGKVFKWKPPEQNTIDFLVEKLEGLYIDKKTQTKYMRFELKTGYDASKWEEIPITNGLERMFPKHKLPPISKEEQYKPHIFKPMEHYDPRVSIAFIPINEVGQAVSMEGEIIDAKDTIVEMSYTPKESMHPSLCWHANRVREDKTKALRLDRSLTANDLSVALNIWHSIHEPVTRDHIIGQTKVPLSVLSPDAEERVLDTNDLYYSHEIPRDQRLSINMLNFHSHGIKAMLYASMNGNAKRLLELGCGSGGDIPRWRDNFFEFILGVDLVKNNIVGTKGAYSRFLNNKKYVKGYYPKAIFVVGDCALPLETGAAAKGKDIDSEKVLKYIYSTSNTDKFTFINKTYFKHGNGHTLPYDMVSCQFAIHYFFESKERIDGFLKNVWKNLKVGGHFIATFMDGDEVHKLIDKTGEAIGEKGKDMIWAIQKKYKSYTKANPYNKAVSVYLENTNKFITEYLVKYEVLIDLAAKFKLKVRSSELFSTTFNTLKNNMTDTSIIKADIEAMAADDVQKKFSFLNRWVIFVREP